MVEAGGVGIFRVVENTQLIDFSIRSKRLKLRNCAQLKRIWNAGFRCNTRIFNSFFKIVGADDELLDQDSFRVARDSPTIGGEGQENSAQRTAGA